MNVQEPATVETPSAKIRICGLLVLLRNLCATLTCVIVLMACLWALLALWYFDLWPRWVRVPVAILWAVAVIVIFSLMPQTGATAVAACGVLLISLAWTFVRPSNERNWTRDQTRMPFANFEADVVDIQHVRYATYRNTDDYDVRWSTKRYDLNAIRTVDFLVEPFAAWRGPAHTLLTFGFSDGEHVAISVEIRKEQGETFSPLKGLFKQYEIMYVIGDEQDLIGLRANVRRNPVYLFPIRATKEQVRALFVSMLQRANQLRKQPQFYNTLANNCITNIIRHLEEVSRQSVSFDLRVLFPGYADELAVELDLINFSGSLDEARERFRINDRSGFIDDGREWSRQIRQVQ